MPAIYGQVTVSWTRNTEADLAGYRIYYSLDGSNVTFLQDIGLTATPLTPSVTLTDLPAYGTLFFHVSAYDTSNNVSAPSAASSSIGIAPKLMPMAWG